MNNGAFERGWHDECKFCEQRNKFLHKCMSIIKTCGNISEWYWYNLKTWGIYQSGSVNKEVVLKSTPQTTAP
jgi:hypothetical protein